MTRRLAPRTVASVLSDALPKAAPPTLLAHVQAAWPGAVGDAIAAESAPVAERGGTVTVACSAAIWAQELDLMGEDLRARLNAALGGSRVGRLRFVTGTTATGP